MINQPLDQSIRQPGSTPSVGHRDGDLAGLRIECLDHVARFADHGFLVCVQVPASRATWCT